ncbi:MAG: nuclear transport factor 2 family protein [Candidatus Binatia bacterium]
MTASEQTRLATVEEHVRGENAHDLDTVMGTFSQGASVTLNGLVTNYDKIRKSYEKRMFALPGFRFEVKQRYFSTDSLIAEHLLHFTNQKGQPMEVPVCIVYLFDETGKLVEERIYMNEAQMM